MEKFLDKNGLITYTNKMKEYIDSKIPAQAQSDWNEASSNSPAYIQNKTHWIDHTLDQSSVVNFYLIKEAEDQTVLADRNDEQKQTTTAEMVGDDYGAFLTYEVGNPSRGKTNPQMENTVVSVTVAGTTYTATPNFIGTQPPISTGDDPSRYYTIGNYNLFYSRCNTNPEVSDTPDGPASITDASQANWPFCIWFITENPASYPAYITIIGFETGTSGYTILGDDEYTIPVTITNVNSTYHPLDARYIPTASSIADGATGYTTGDQVYDYVQAHKADAVTVTTVKVNGSALTPDANKAVDITVPTAAASIAAGATGYATGDQVKTYVDSNGFNPSNMQTVSETVTINQASIPVASAISNGETGFTTGDQVYDYIQERVPDAPTTDGTYVLKVTVSNGNPTYSWVSA